MTMPAPRRDTLSASTLAEFSRRLEETRDFHLSRLGVDDLESDDIALAMARRSEATLELIEAALERLEAGAYGLCQACRAPISEERLDAVPHADLCARCAGGAG